MAHGEVDAAIAVWLAANGARGKAVNSARRARVRDKLVHSDALVLVAANGAIAGMALAEPGRASDGAGEVLSDLLHVSMVFVDPSRQREGVGRALLAGLIDIAVRGGNTRISLWTASDNEAARRLYESSGMVAVARRPISVTTEWVRYERVLSGV